MTAFLSNVKSRPFLSSSSFLRSRSLINCRRSPRSVVCINQASLSALPSSSLLCSSTLSPSAIAISLESTDGRMGGRGRRSRSVSGVVVSHTAISVPLVCLTGFTRFLRSLHIELVCQHCQLRFVLRGSGRN